MSAGHAHLVRPSSRFRLLPMSERRRLATEFLDLFQTFRKAYRAEGRVQGSPAELIAWAVVGEDIEAGIDAWRGELYVAQREAQQGQGATGDDKYPGAGRSPAIKGQGCPAPLAGWTGRAPRPGVKTPYTPTAVISSKETHS